jgi:sulfite reductase (NADPH) hemoprotein beta-component
MYQYDELDQRLVDERVTQYRDQVRRRLAGELTEDEFRPLRLKNGLYLQRHAYMLRVAIPYGLIAARQMRTLAHIARRYDRGYGHFTTRQNIQYNWLQLEDSPDILADLAAVQMHAIQTSGNCVRNISADHLAGVTADEVADPRPWCEILRQRSTFHPEFSYLPRKFKIAFSGATQDRAATAFHDIGYRLVRDEQGRLGFRILVGGGMGRTPHIAPVINPFCKPEDLLSYTEAILRVYNLFGNRENKFRARIKILVRSMGIEAFTEAVEREFERIRHGQLRLDATEIDRVSAHFNPPPYVAQPGVDLSAHLAQPAFARWHKHNVYAHKVPGYAVVFVSLKSPSLPPGDITAEQMDRVADLSERFSFGLIRATHDQNLVLADVPIGDLPELHRELDALGLATPNIGALTDMICCPGLDFCSLANASSIPVARQITDRFDDLDYLYDLGELRLKMSGCINACGHHHVGHIGILGINKSGEEYYQIMLGGSHEDDASLGQWIGQAIPQARVADALERILDVYVERREPEERFLDTYRRIGVTPFKERVYANHPQ